MKIGVVRR